ncbi:MAG: phosphodiester glycosidase family protein [Polyangiales bacterium]
MLYSASAAIGRADHTRDSRPLHTQLALTSETRRVPVHRFRLPVQGLAVEVVDLSYERVLHDALEDADLVVNGGFWGWVDAGRRTLIGLVSAGGRELSPLRHALDGGVLALHEGKARITASRGYRGPRGSQPVTLALQCRPRLLVDGALVNKLDTRGHAARTAVCVRDAGATLDVYATDPRTLGPTLAELGQFLLAQGCEQALNLDGGPSTAAAFREQGEVVRIGAGRELPYALRFRIARE